MGCVGIPRVIQRERRVSEVNIVIKVRGVAERMRWEGQERRSSEKTYVRALLYCIKRQGYRKVGYRVVQGIHNRDKGMWLVGFSIPLPICYDCRYSDNQ